MIQFTVRISRSNSHAEQQRTGAKQPNQEPSYFPLAYARETLHKYQMPLSIRTLETNDFSPTQTILANPDQDVMNDEWARKFMEKVCGMNRAGSAERLTALSNHDPVEVEIPEDVLVLLDHLENELKTNTLANKPFHDAFLLYHSI